MRTHVFVLTMLALTALLMGGWAWCKLLVF